MIRFSEIAGQESAIAVLRSAVRGGALHHALLFVGPKGVGKFTTATALAAFLLCPNRGEDACGSPDCSSCVQIAAGFHPDLHIESLRETRVEEIDKKRSARQEVAIEQIRHLQASLGQRALGGGKKVAIVDDANRLSEPAQNAFLKTLEEPPGDTLIVLVSPTASTLLPTIRSRCQRVPFRPLSAAAVEQIVASAKDLSPQEARLVAEYSQGSPGIALSSDAALVRTARDDVRALLEQVRRGGYREVVLAQQKTTSRKPAPREPRDPDAAVPKREPDRGKEPEAIELLVELLRGDLRATAGAAASPELTARGKTESVGQALRRVEAAYNAFVDLGRNAHAALTIERLWLRLGEDRA